MNILEIFETKKQMNNIQFEDVRDYIKQEFNLDIEKEDNFLGGGITIIFPDKIKVHFGIDNITYLKNSDTGISVRSISDLLMNRYQIIKTRKTLLLESEQIDILMKITDKAEFVDMLDKIIPRIAYNYVTLDSAIGKIRV